MATITIARDILLKAIAAEVKRQSFGTAQLNISMIEGVLPSGEGFEIESVRVTTAAPKPKDFHQRSAPAGIGKIRLAAVDGEVK